MPTRLTYRCLLSSLLLALGACGDSAMDTDGPVGPMSDGGPIDLRRPADLHRTTDGGFRCDSDGGAHGGDLGSGCTIATDPDGPMVSFVAPLAGEQVLGKTITTQVQVLLRTGEGSLSHVLLLLQSTGASIALTATGTANLYTGSLDVAALPSGTLTLAAVAVDLNGKVGAASVVVSHDAGPRITAYQPLARTYRGSAPVLFSIENTDTNTAFDIDPQATVATVQQVRIPIALVPGQTPATWDGTIDFHSKTFAQALSGNQILHLVARDKAGATSQLDVPFTVDEIGPTITLLAPGPGDYVGGVTTIRAQIDDPSGVDAPTVLAVWGGDVTHSVTLTQIGSNLYSSAFDTRQLPSSYVLPVLSVRAQDSLGNAGEQGEEVVIDNVGPAIDLAPPDIHFIRESDRVCSHPVDPVGVDAIDDGDVMPQLQFVRARIEDRGNVASGQAVVFFSLVDPASVRLYIIREADGPVIVDTDGDGVCDDVNPDLVPSNNLAMPKQALVVPLVPIPSAGVPDFSTGGSDGVCNKVGSLMDVAPLKSLCDPSPIIVDLTYGIHRESSIWTIPPVKGAPELTCQGVQLDAANSIPDGPVCVAVVAMDKVTNRNVSRPLRLCVDKQLKGGCDSGLYQAHNVGLATNHAALPDCTGSVVNGKVDGTKHCQPGVKLNTGLVTEAFPAPEKVLWR